MYVEAVRRQMAVCSAEGVCRLIALDRDYWNVVSIRGPWEKAPDLRHAKRVHSACFDDTEEASSTLYRSPKAGDVADIFAFIQKLDVGSTSEPLLIHCQQGISRSAAVALSWLYGQLPPTKDRVRRAIDLVLHLRPQAKPNRLVLVLGLSQFVPAAKARDLRKRILSEPRLVRNSFQDPRE